MRVCGRDECLCVCVGGKISACSLPLHTAEQIGEVVRSHNMRGPSKGRRELKLGALSGFLGHDGISGGGRKGVVFIRVF